ncbi:DUF4198 domain-containing protein [Acinetobacter larvae]|uniref:DUF4198 domain-containing protein n=1 Tax=Acinetobacter larvae TaxID=1789224 RepID=A0A1B2LZT7_9GAMM|nr:DUF4198 domain-containing protein [Acinetobacter larvae]AOA58447.1 hypothetical protein BFG52_08830 [Acinetobacter larvae]
MKVIQTAGFATLMLCAFNSHAHMLWLEQPDAQTVRAYFGEYAESLSETQQGPLKSFNAAVATQDKNTYKPQVQEKFIEYKVKGTGDVRVQQDLLHGEMLAQFRAKTGRSSTQPVAEFEIVPTQANGNQFTVYFQGKPLAKQEVEVVADNRWTQKFYTNEQGQFTINTPWKGQYVLEAGKPVEEAGQFQAKPYKTKYLVATLSFNVQ